MAQPVPVRVEVGFFGTQNALQQMNVLGRAAQQFGSQLTSRLAGTFGAVAIGAAAFNKVEQAMNKNIATAKQISGLAIKFNMDPSQVHAIKIAADDAGVSVRSLLMASKALGKAAEQGGSSKAMLENWQQLGFAAEEVNQIQSRPMQYLPKIAERLARITDENERSAAGAMLLGRQYQQLIPLLDKLGESEEAREKFLKNQNAMTKEEIEANREIARINSQMEESMNKLAAAGTGIVSWSKAFASNIMDAVAGLLEYLKRRGEIEDAENKEDAGEIGLRAAGEVEAMHLRRIARKEKVAKGEKLTAEEEQEEALIKQYGSIENYVATMIEKGIQEAKGEAVVRTMAGMGDGGAGMRIMAEKNEKEIYGGDQALRQQVLAFTKRIGRERFMNAADVNSDVPAKVAEAMRKQQTAHADMEVVRDAEGLLYRVNRTTGERIRFTAGGQTEALNAVTQGQDTAGAHLQRLHEYGANYMSSFYSAYGGGTVYDKKTGKTYSPQEYAKLIESRKAGDEDGGLSFEDAKARMKREKEEKRAQRALKRSQARADRPEGMSAVEKAEEALQEQEDAKADAREDVAEKEAEISDKQTGIKNLNAAAEEFKRKKEEFEQKVADIENQLGRKLDDTRKASIAQQVFGLGHGETLADREKFVKEQLEGVKDLEKQILTLDLERIKLQTKLNTETAKETQLRDALRKAEEAEWAKNKNKERDKRKDDEDHEREKGERRRRDMRLDGASEMQIKEDVLKQELDFYEKSVQERAELEEEIENKRIKREELGLGPDLTDEEEAQLKAAREKQDAARKKTDDALYALADEKGSKVVASDAGRHGGGRVVQFGTNNPVELIRKSNDYLALIAKNTDPTKFAARRAALHAVYTRGSVTKK